MTTDRNPYHFLPIASFQIGVDVEDNVNYSHVEDAMDKITKNIANNVSSKRTRKYNQVEMLEYFIALIVTFNKSLGKKEIDYEYLIMKKFIKFVLMKRFKGVLDIPIIEVFRFDDNESNAVIEIHGRMYGYYKYDDIVMVGYWHSFGEDRYLC